MDLRIDGKDHFEAPLNPITLKEMIRLRTATIRDLELLCHWDAQQHVIDSDPDEDWDWELELQKDPEWREQLIAELEGEPIGFLQIIDPYLEETRYWGDVGPHKRAIDIWIGEAHNLNKGYGTIMMQLAAERCFAHPEVDGILIDPLKSNKKAHRFYERLGFKFVEEREFNGARCFVYELKRPDHTAKNSNTMNLSQVEFLLNSLPCHKKMDLTTAQLQLIQQEDPAIDFTLEGIEALAIFSLGQMHNKIVRFTDSYFQNTKVGLFVIEELNGESDLHFSQVDDWRKVEINSITFSLSGVTEWGEFKDTYPSLLEIKRIELFIQ